MVQPAGSIAQASASRRGLRGWGQLASELRDRVVDARGDVDRSAVGAHRDVVGAGERRLARDVAATTAPETIKGKGPAKTITTRKKKAKVKFAFSSPEAGVTFECSLDAKAFSACASPVKAKVKVKRKAKKHNFKVRAVDAAGNADATPVDFRFKLKRKR